MGAAAAIQAAAAMGAAAAMAAEAKVAAAATMAAAVMVLMVAAAAIPKMRRVESRMPLQQSRCSYGNWLDFLRN